MKRLLLNCLWFIEHLLKIRNKKGEVVPLKLNKPQRRLYDTVKDLRAQEIPVRIIVLKARQMGFSTLIEAILFWAITTAKNVMALVVAHQEDATNNLFAMSKRYYDNLPDPVKPLRKASNARELLFAAPTHAPPGTVGLDSSMRIATAGGHGVGRSFTLKLAHLSEFAFWPGDKGETLNGIMQAVPDEPGTMVFIESTANGFDQFKDIWDEAIEAWNRGERDGWCPFFAAWWEMEEYRRRVPRGFTRTEEEQQLAEAYGLDDEQLAWRRWCIKVNCGGDVKKFRQEYPASPDEAFVASGTCYFDQEAIVLWREHCKDSCMARGRFTYDYDGREITNIRWEEDEQGEIRILELPKERVPYVIGGDTAGDSGGVWSDFFVGQVLDNMTGRQAAVLHAKLDEDEYARLMYCLGWYYNWALIAPETNYSTHPTKELARLRYPRLYEREIEDTYTGKRKKSYGFETTTGTRPVIMAEIKEVARDSLDGIRDYETLGEMLSFAKNEKGKPEALPGKHDDLVLALAIAHHVRPQQRMTLFEEPEEPVIDEDDLIDYDDYMTGGETSGSYLDFG